MSSANATGGCEGCDEIGPPLVVCLMCGWEKAPIGRAIPLGTYYCHGDCPGYRETPYPSQLWPGERWGDSMPCIHRPPTPWSTTV